MATLPTLDRERLHAQTMRDGLCPPHWDKAALRDAIASIDDGLDALLGIAATALGASAVEIAEGFSDADAIAGLMSIQAFRERALALRVAAETAAGGAFQTPAEVGGKGLLVGQRRFARLTQSVIARRNGKYPAEEDANG